MYDALILVNGEIPRQECWQKLPYRTLICTDGAATFLNDLALTPDVIIGDMDSIADRPQNATAETLKLQFPHSQIIRIFDQDTTDFEKALIYSAENKFQRVLCIGVLGKSADHSFYNLCLLTRFAQSLELVVLSVSGDETQWIIPLRTQTTIHTAKHLTLSLLALSEATVTSQGLKWELNNTPLSATAHQSIRNQTVDQTVQLYCQGDCLAFLTSPSPPDIAYE